MYGAMRPLPSVFGSEPKRVPYSVVVQAPWF